MDFTLAKIMNKSIDEKEQEKIIDELIADIDEEINGYTSELETEIDYLILAAIAGLLAAIHLIQIF